VNLSDHFTLQEFVTSQTATRLGINNTPDASTSVRLMELCENVLEPVRVEFGPVIISSGYRSPKLNQAIGGSENSQHCKGEAADIIIPHADPYDVCQWIANSGLEFDQLIYEGRWTHISYNAERNRGNILTAHFQAGKPTTYTRGLE